MLIIIPFGCYSLFLVTLGITLAMRRTKGSAITFAGFLALPFVVMFFGSLSSPTEPSRSDIIGHYVIDRSKCPGANADWQHQTYSLDITEGQVIVHDSRTKTVWKSWITWQYGSKYRWSFTDDSKRHHLIAEGPAIYRQPFGYHYVFRSPLYGDVFFKKE